MEESERSSFDQDGLVSSRSPQHQRGKIFSLFRKPSEEIGNQEQELLDIEDREPSNNSHNADFPDYGDDDRDDNNPDQDFLLEEERIPKAKQDFSLYSVLSSRGTFPWFTICITLFELFVLITEIIFNGGFESLKINPWLGVSSDTVIYFGGKYNDNILAGQWWRFISPIVLHVGVLHYLSNMLLQIPVGIQLEWSMGWWRVSLIYIISGIGGNLLSAVFLPRLIEIGASSSLYGWLSVYLVDIIANWKYYKSPKKKLLFWTVGTLLSLAMGIFPYIDNFAHLGGSISGLTSSLIIVPGFFSGYDQRRRNKMVYIRLLGVATTLLYFIPCFAIFYARVDVPKYCHWCEEINCLPIWDWCREYANGNDS